MLSKRSLFWKYKTFICQYRRFQCYLCTTPWKNDSIEVIALDNLQGNFEDKRILLKADIEGSELDMLNGAQKFIKKIQTSYSYLYLS